MDSWFSSTFWIRHLDFSLNEGFQSVRFEKLSRYYIIRLEKDLLEDWIITATNGRIKTKLGQSRTFSFPNFQEAFYHFCEMTNIRFKRHYHLVQFKAENVIALQTLFWIWLHANLGTKRKTLQPKEKPPKSNRPLPKTEQLSFVFN